MNVNHMLTPRPTTTPSKIPLHTVQCRWAYKDLCNFILKISVGVVSGGLSRAWCCGCEKDASRPQQWRTPNTLFGKYFVGNVVENWPENFIA
jgi:hypothetical protein